MIRHLRHTGPRVTLRFFLGACLMGVVLAASLLLAGCAQSQDPLEKLNRNTRGETGQSYTSEELKEFNGQGYFTDDHTYQEIVDASGLSEGTYVDGEYSEGVYLVSEDGLLKPGLYFLQGSQEAYGEFSIYRPFPPNNEPVKMDSSEEQRYAGESAVQYLGWYFVKLQEKDLLVFEPSDVSFKMMLASPDPMDMTAPYLSGCYRVGIDLPAGTYSITVDEAAAAVIQNTLAPDPAAAVMSGVMFREDESNIVQEVNPSPGESIEITAEDGQYLELYAVQAVPV